MFIKSWRSTSFVALTMLAALTLMGQACAFQGRPEQAPLTGSREDLEKNLQDVMPDKQAADVQMALHFFFNHTKPGSYSDLYAEFTGTPYTMVHAMWSGPCLSDNKPTDGETDAKGTLTEDKRITCFGKYTVSGTATKNGHSTTFSQTLDVK